MEQPESSAIGLWLPLMGVEGTVASVPAVGSVLDGVIREPRWNLLLKCQG